MRIIFQKVMSSLGLGIIMKIAASIGRHSSCLNHPIIKASLSFRSVLVRVAVVAARKAHASERPNHILFVKLIDVGYDLAWFVNQLKDKQVFLLKVARF